MHFICCGWVNRYFSKVKGEFCEDVLGLTQIHGHTRGKDIYEAIKMLNERGIDIQTAVSIATDGLPESLLQGKCSFCCFTLDGRVAMLRIPRIGCTWIEVYVRKRDRGTGCLTRWLSRGRVPKPGLEYLEFLQDDDNMELVAFFGRHNISSKGVQSQAPRQHSGRPDGSSTLLPKMAGELWKWSALEVWSTAC